MPGKKTGMSGVREQAQGFVGRWVVIDTTANHKLRIRFDLGCGKPDEKRGKLVTWRHCIAYGEQAEKLRDIKQGDLVYVLGWVTTERVSHGDEPLAKKEYLILFAGEKVDKGKLAGDDKQMAMALAVGQIS